MKFISETQHKIIEGVNIAAKDISALQHQWLAQFLNFYHSEKLKISRINQKIQTSKNEKQRASLQKEILAMGERRKQYLKLISPFIGLETQEILALTEKDLMPQETFLFKYPKNLFRDWVWGDQETQENFKILQSLFDIKKQWNHLSIGAGSCRWSWEIHQRFTCENTICMDLNPLLISVGQKMLAGKSIKLTEIMDLPISIEKISVDHKIHFPKREPKQEHSSFQFLVADFFSSPLAPGQFNLVTTPWFIDILEHPLDLILANINKHLEVGGLWLNWGTYSFLDWHPESLMAFVEQRGFKIIKSQQSDMPYLHSPYEAQKRTENILFFIAEKTEDVSTTEVSLPSWIEDITQTIPQLDLWAQEKMINEIPYFVFSQLDGKKSIKDLAILIEKKYGLPQEQASESLRNFFQKKL